MQLTELNGTIHYEYELDTRKPDAASLTSTLHYEEKLDTSCPDAAD